MKTAILFTLLSVSVVLAEPFPKVFFEDDFSGNELKKQWGSWKSETVVKDGVMVGITPKTADHPSVNTIELPPLSDMEVAVSFKFAGSKRFSVMFRDLDYKGSHAGHICHVAVGAEAVTLYDGKTGIFLKDIRDKRKAGIKLDEATNEMLKTKQVKYAISIDPEVWHKLKIRIQGDELKVWIDDKPAGSLKSVGITHKTKSNMNITTVDREVHYDDFSIRIP
ncbi:MAG: DUF1080 domain-containing protein [Verrucomicrobiales bacterium]|nr:DUF1080 domain-containing protein [Verrucomicrobiales bacterium]